MENAIKQHDPCMARNLQKSIQVLSNYIFGENVMITRKCPVCDGGVRIYPDDNPGDEVYCDECGQEFRLLSVDPIRLEALDMVDDYYFEEDEY